MPLLLARNNDEYNANIATHPRSYLLLNAQYNDSMRAIKLNVQPNNTGWRTVGMVHPPFPTFGPLPFQLNNLTRALSFGHIGQWVENFAKPRNALAQYGPLGNIPVGDPLWDNILHSCQDMSYWFVKSFYLIHALHVNTPLYDAYRNHAHNRFPAPINGIVHPLVNNNALTAHGDQLLEWFAESNNTYRRIPELTTWHSHQDQQPDVNAPVAGVAFAGHLAGGHHLALDGIGDLQFVDYELKPLNISGPGFLWAQAVDDDAAAQVGDIRLHSIDVLGRMGNCPVWCEFKMNGDRWASAALLQILYYGSMLGSDYQRTRTHRFYPQLGAQRAWLAVIVEDRKDNGFIQDFEMTCSFCKNIWVKHVLAPCFRGVLLIRVRRNGAMWVAEQAQPCEWNV